MDETKRTEETTMPGVGENVAPTAPTQPALTEEQVAKLKQQKEFFFRLRQGGTFLKFIFNDIERQKKQHLNRAQRRRFEKELRKGDFSKELIDVYTSQIEDIEKYIDEQLNPKPVAEVKEVDGAEYLAELRAKEARGELKEEPKA